MYLWILLGSIDLRFTFVHSLQITVEKLVYRRHESAGNRISFEPIPSRSKHSPPSMASCSDTASGTTSLDAQPRPWQFDWKRPQWESPLPLNNNESLDNVQGRLTHHTAAAVRPTEMQAHTSFGEYSSSSGSTTSTSSTSSSNSNSTSTNTSYTAASSYLLTVSLLSTKPSATATSTTSSKHMNTVSTATNTLPPANAILIELIQQQQPSSTTAVGAPNWIPHVSDPNNKTLDDADPTNDSNTTLKCLHSRLLQWPESALLDQNDESEHEGLERNPFWRILLGGGGRATDSTAVGLVSVSLCRLPPVTPTATVLQDALDVVHLLSMGTTTGLSVSQQQWLAHLRTQAAIDTATTTTTTTTQDATTDGAATAAAAAAGGGTSDLMLACLTSDGNVHFYSPWDLLGTAANTALDNETVKKSQQDDMDHAMASLMLGDSVLTSIQESILPLSQPLQSIALSVPLYRPKPKQNRPFSSNKHHRHSAATATATTVIPEDDELETQIPHSSATSSLLWDPSAWDPTIDAATYRYRTTDNAPVTTAFCLDYLCIAGKGRRRKQQRGERDGRSGWTTRTPPSTPQSIFSRRAPASPPPPVLFETNTTEGGGTPQQQPPLWVLDGVVGTISMEDAGAEAVASLADTATVSFQTGNTIRSEQEGGFVTFISLRNFAEVRTVYLPFAPRQLFPFVWGGMSFLLVLGESVAVAIRTDASEVSTVIDGKAPSSFAPAEQDGALMEVDALALPGAQNKETLIDIHRFQVLPIRFPEPANSNFTIVASAVSVSPPELVFLLHDEHGTTVVRRALDAVKLVSTVEAAPIFADYKPKVGEDGIAVIGTEYCQTARIGSSLYPTLDHESTWCHVDQGWCIVGVGNVVYFICWEGAVAATGPFVFELAEESNECMHGLVSAHVLPVNPFASGTAMAYQDLKLPFTEPYEKPLGLRQLAEATESNVTDMSEELDDFVIEALESISSLNYRETVVNQSAPSSPRRKSTSFTSREKSERLLRQCSSWVQLEQSQQTRTRFELQEPAVSVRMGGNSTEHFILSLRKIVMESGEAAPFPQVLSWLSDQEDYFTAASLALDLLRDADSLRYLWKAFDKIGNDDERTRLGGLLDGVTPIYGESDDKVPLQSTLTQLADMAIGCLTKGGYTMSSTLEHFVKRNPSYDPARAGLMLVATVACTLSGDEDTVSSVMGKDYRKNVDHAENTMWPVRCLLQIGVARGQLFTALLLLNATVPDELRQRRRSAVPTSSLPSMEMCKSLVSLIVASSPEAADLLLGLVDEQSRQPYWQSLQHPTRLELSLLSMDGKCPMLRQSEVRAWAIEQLQKCNEAECSGSSVNVFEITPTYWLQALAMACLTNAGCSTDIIFKSTFGESSKETAADSDGLAQHVEDLQTTRNALVTAPGSGGLDFDLLIPALLILQHRDVLWREVSNVSTQSILNAACYLAGRRNIEEPLFALDSATLMRQCTLTGNVPAGANLVGGKSGLILECCDILMQQVAMSMDQAEAFLLADPMPTNVGGTESGSGDAAFTVQYGHRHILWLLEEHVLRIRTFGEFETTHLRGKVDPIFAATVCLRSWWRVTRHHLDAATTWLVDWLSAHLGMHGKDNDTQSITMISPNRLACAALVRALVWPCISGSSRSGSGSAVEAAPVLARQFGMSSHFLVQLAQACCGLVEAVPAQVAEEAWKLMESNNTSFTSSSMNVSTTLTDLHPAMLLNNNNNEATAATADGIKRSASLESILSAVSSIRSNG